MIAIVNHFRPHVTDLSVRLGSDFKRCTVLPAGETSTGWSRPSHAFASQAHLDAIRGLSADDPRRTGLSSFEFIDMGELGSDGRYESSALATLANALAPRKLTHIHGPLGQLVRVS